MNYRKHILTASILAAVSLANAFGDTAAVTVQPSATTSGLGDLALAAAKLAGSYIQTNGSQSVSSGFSGFGTHRIAIAPVLSQSLTLAQVGKIGVDTLSFGVEHATSFQPNANRECLGLGLNWHIWKASKIGRVFAFNFGDAGLSTAADAPVEWFTGQNIKLSGLVLRVGAFVHF